MTAELINGSSMPYPDRDGASNISTSVVVPFPREGMEDRRSGVGDRRASQLQGAMTADGFSVEDMVWYTEPFIASETETQLVPVEGVASDLRPSRAMHEAYVSQREAVKLLPKVEGDELTSIQESVRTWIAANPGFTEGQDYSKYDQQHLTDKLYGLTNYLRENFGDKVNELELATSESFVTSIFGMYEDREADGVISPDADGSFAFIVPMRSSRIDKDYGQEVEPAIPALRYVPNELRAQMLVGVPPFIIDTYKQGPDGRRGYLVLAPVFTDMGLEMFADGANLGDIHKAARPRIDDAVDFAHERLGVTIAGLGATLPSLTNFGRTVQNPNVLITNGHGGTAYLVKETARKAIDEGLVASSEHPKVGVLGNGAIGGPMAVLAATEFDPPTGIFDTDESKRNRTQRNIEEVGGVAVQMDNEEHLVNTHDVILSAIVGRVSLAGFKEIPDLTGKVIVDDSQPGSFDPREVAKHGGTVVWVIARDTEGHIRREGYDYATMVDMEKDLFGCEAEAGTLALYRQELLNRGMSEKMTNKMLKNLAVKEPVTPRKARLIGALFKKYGIVPSEFQAFGQLIEKQ